MIVGLTFTDNVSITTVLVIVGAVVSIWVTVKSGGPWRSIAEGYKQERDELVLERDNLVQRVGLLEAKPDLQAISTVLTTITSSLAAIVVSLQHLQETQVLIDGRMHDHEEAAKTRNIELMALVRGNRNPDTRTRRDDQT